MVNETISIQIGSLANHIFLHFWKYQEFQLLKQQLDDSPFLHDALFQLSSPVELSKPRLLSVDLQETVDFGLNFNSSLLSNSFDFSHWDGQSVTVIRSPNDSSASDCQVNSSFANNNWLNCLSYKSRGFWCENDILFKLPTTFTTVNNNLSADCSSNSLSTFIQGMNSVSPGNSSYEECYDRIRRLAECCSHPNMFQLAVNADDAFGGIGLRIIEIISEEFPKQTLFTTPIYNSSMVKSFSKQCQQIAASNQLSLINALESSDFTSHGVWLPLDVSGITDQANVCDKMSLIAGAFDTMIITPTHLKKRFGGQSLDSLLEGLQFAEGRKMLTLRTGIYDEFNNYHIVQGYDLNPYTIMGKSLPKSCDGLNGAPVLDRKLMFRGITNPNWIDDFHKFASISRDNNNNIQSEDCLSVFDRLPTVCPGASIKTLGSLPQYPLEINCTPNFQCCLQATCRRQFGLLDVPNRDSMESYGLENLVTRCQQCKYPPDTQMELELWKEMIETGQIQFADAYKKVKSF